MRAEVPGEFGAREGVSLAVMKCSGWALTEDLQISHVEPMLRTPQTADFGDWDGFSGVFCGACGVSHN